MTTSTARELLPHLRYIDYLWLIYIISKKDYPFMSPRDIPARDGGALYPPHEIIITKE